MPTESVEQRIMATDLPSTSIGVTKTAKAWDIQAMRDEVTLVIPTLNEVESIGHLLDEVSGAGYGHVMIVDGHSDDHTQVIAESRGAMVLQQQGKGKAGALVTAFRRVETPFLLVMDGDGSYDPADVDKFLPLLSEFDFVKGERARNGNMSSLHRLGNRVITRSFNVLFGTGIADVCSGMYLLRTDKAKALTLEKHPLTVEQEIAAQMLLSSSRVTNVPVNYRKRFGGRSKTKTWRQGFRDLVTNFDLARSYNPIFLGSFLAALAIIPAFGLLGYALVLNYGYHDYHSGYFLGSAILLILGVQGLTVSTIAIMLRRLERKLSEVV